MQSFFGYSNNLQRRREKKTVARKIILSTILLCTALLLFAQEIQHESIVVNIEVQTRVFRGNTFIDNLTKDDFLLYEDGVLQEIDAVYLIKKNRH